MNRGGYRLRTFVERQDFPEAGKKLGKVISSFFSLSSLSITFHFNAERLPKLLPQRKRFLLIPPGFFPPKKSLQLVAVASGFGDDKEAESSVCAKGTKSKDCKEEADGDGMVTDEQKTS